MRSQRDVSGDMVASLDAKAIANLTTTYNQYNANLRTFHKAQAQRETYAQRSQRLLKRLLIRFKVDDMGDYRPRISPKGFFYLHPGTTEVLEEEVEPNILDGDVVKGSLTAHEVRLINDLVTRLKHWETEIARLEQCHYEYRRACLETYFTYFGNYLNDLIKANYDLNNARLIINEVSGDVRCSLGTI